MHAASAAAAIAWSLTTDLRIAMIIRTRIKIYTRSVGSLFSEMNFAEIGFRTVPAILRKRTQMAFHSARRLTRAVNVAYVTFYRRGYADANFESERAARKKLDGFGDNLVTVPTKLHKSRAVLSLKRVASYNVSTA
jgi:hypothetical protein